MRVKGGRLDISMHNYVMMVVPAWYVVVHMVLLSVCRVHSHPEIINEDSAEQSSIQQLDRESEVLNCTIRAG